MPPAVRKQVATVQRKPKVKLSASVLDRILDISEDCDDEYLRCLFYGESGTGKTTAWATFPGPILAILCSGGLKPGELRSVKTPANKGRIKRVSINSTDEMKELIEHANSGFYKTVVLDHVSGFQDLKLMEVLGITEIPAQKSWGLATQEQYGEVSLECKTILRQFLSIPANTIIIGQQRTDGKADGTTDELLAPTVGVALIPSLAGWLYPAVDYICQTFKRPRMIKKETKVGKGPNAKTLTTIVRGKGVDYCLRTGPHDVFTTKFRVPKGGDLPEIIVDPDYNKLMKVLQGVTK